MKIPHFPIYHPQAADDQTLVNGPLFLHSNFSKTVRLRFTLDVHETLLAFTLHVYRPIFEDL